MQRDDDATQAPVLHRREPRELTLAELLEAMARLYRAEFEAIKSDGAVAFGAEG